MKEFYEMLTAPYGDDFEEEVRRIVNIGRCYSPVFTPEWHINMYGGVTEDAVIVLVVE